MISAEVIFDKDFTPEVQTRIESRVFRVYVEDGIKRKPKAVKSYFQGKRYRNIYSIKGFHGGPSRYKGKPSKSTIREVFKVLYNWLTGNNIDIFNDPFKDSNSDIIRLTNAYLKMTMSDKQRFSKNMLKNLAQAIVRNPILRLDYGNNSPNRIKEKGFDRLLMDTGEVFTSIKGEVFNKRKKRAKIKR